MDNTQGKNEAALACIARSGDKDALRRLLERNWRWLRGLTWNLIRSPDDLDDVLQNVCVQVIARIGQLREPERFRSWLATIARNEALRWRKTKARGPVPLDDPTAAPAETPAVLDRLAADEEAALVRKAVAQLPDKYREVFVLACCDDLTYAQIGEILDIPLTTVQIRLVRARRMVYDLVTTGTSDRIPRT